MSPRNYMQFFICRLDPKTQNTQKHKENQDIHKGVGRRRRPTPLWRRPKAASLIFLVFLCILGFGVESTYNKLHIISEKHAQELYVDFYMPPKASQNIGTYEITENQRKTFHKWRDRPIYHSALLATVCQVTAGTGSHQPSSCLPAAAGRQVAALIRLAAARLPAAC